MLGVTGTGEEDLLCTGVFFSRCRNSLGMLEDVSCCRRLGCGEALLSDSLSLLAEWRVERRRDCRASGSALRRLGVAGSPVVWLSVDCGVDGFSKGGLGESSSWLLRKKGDGVVRPGVGNLCRTYVMTDSLKCVAAHSAPRTLGTWRFGVGLGDIGAGTQ